MLRYATVVLLSCSVATAHAQKSPGPRSSTIIKLGKEHKTPPDTVRDTVVIYKVDTVRTTVYVNQTNDIFQTDTLRDTVGTGFLVPFLAGAGAGFGFGQFLCERPHPPIQVDTVLVPGVTGAPEPSTLWLTGTACAICVALAAARRR